MSEPLDDEEDGVVIDEQEILDVDDVAGEVIVEESYEYRKDPPKFKRTMYPSNVLRTVDSLKGNPRLYVPIGRPKSKQDADGEEDDEPPRLSDPDGGVATPGLKPLFRVYKNAALAKADYFFQEGVRPRQQPSEDEVDERVEVVEEVELDAADGGEIVEEMGVLAPDMEELVVEEDTMEQLEPEDDREPSTTVDSKEGLMYDISKPGEPQLMRRQFQFFHEEWPMYWDQPIDFTEACEILIGIRPVPPSKVCRSCPQGFKGSGTFVVDLNTFHSRHDVYLDGLGYWAKPAGRARFFGIGTNGKLIRLDDMGGTISDEVPYEYKCQLKRYEHPAATDRHPGKFVKRIYTAVLPAERQAAVSMAVVTYEWTGTPFDFQVTSGHLEVQRTRRKAGNVALPPEGTRSWEMASFHASSFSSLPDTVNAYYGNCPLYSVGAINFQEAAHICLGATIVEEIKICDRVPQGYRQAGTFVIDVRNFVTDAELRRDDNGIWGKPAGNSRFFKLDPASNTCTRVDRSGKLPPGTSYDFQVLCKRYEHPTVENRFVRKIYTGRVPIRSNNLQHTCSILAVITYYWKGEPEHFEVTTPQRKVRINRSSDLEQMKRMAMMGDMLVEGDEPLYVEEMNGQYLEDPPQLQPPPPPPPPRKKRKVSTTIPLMEQRHLSSGYSMPEMRHPLQDDMIPGPSNMMDAGSYMETENRGMLWKRDLENQRRFSSVLDRMEMFMERMERVVDVMLGQVYLPQSSQESTVGASMGRGGGDFMGESQQVVHQEEVVMEEVEETYEGYEVDGNRDNMNIM